MTTDSALRPFLDGLVLRFETAAFIADDPVSVPHAFDDPDDRAVIGLFAALLAWGRRRTILDKLGDLCARMRYAPARFVRGYDDARDGDCLAGFVHRTFSHADARALCTGLRVLLDRHGSLEAAFADGLAPDVLDVGPAIEAFSGRLLTAVAEPPPRFARHVALPSRGSACKRLAMYLRWMVRPGPVDFGAWTRIAPRQLVLPLDVHSGRVARALGLLARPADDWRAVLELTAACRALDTADPARYDFAFFGAGVNGVPLPEGLVHSAVPPVFRD